MNMKMTILQAKQKLHEKWMKLTKDGTDEEMMQALSIADTVLGNYDESLTSDTVDILTEIEAEIARMSDSVVEGRSVTITSWTGMQKRIVKLIQSKIDKLNAQIDVKREYASQPRCKDCKYFEYDSMAMVDGMPLIVAHEICSRWGDGCKSSENGYCFLFEPKDMGEEKR